MDFATRALHSGFDSSAWGGSSVMPIVASAAYSPGTPEALEDIFAGDLPACLWTSDQSDRDRIGTALGGN
jgi:O-acetylhomoserine/O-acetylserine sulfhydrylase-like pyridoxal-dependent enzyme